MKSIFYILLISFILSYSSLVFSQDYPQDATPYTVDTSTQGINTNPTILQKPSSLLEGSVDIRIHPSTNTTQSEMSVAISPMNNQIILASANCSDYPVTQIYGTGYYVSTDGGNTWAGSDQPPSGSLNKGDPAAVIDRQGNFYIGSIASNKGQGIMKSTDQGASWSYIQIANPTVSGTILDKNHLTVDNTTGSYSGYLYSAWSDFGYSDRRITVMRSTDHGQSWNSKNVISSGFAGSGLGHQGVNLQVAPDGAVYACWAVRDSDSPYTERGIGFNKSTDGGATWGQAKYSINNIKGMRQNPYPTLGIRTNSFPVMGINMHTGRMYIAWVNVGIPGVNTGDPDIYLIYSDDNGDNWSTPIRVNNDQIDNGALQFHIWLSVDPVTDVLYIAFYDNRENIGTNECEFYIAKSIEDGLTFINYPVSDNYFSVGPLPGFGSNYNGEYPGIAARGGRFIPIWHSQVPSENAQGWVSPETNISFTVDQQKSNGSSFGLIFHWESYWEDYPVPHTFDDWEEGETHTLRADTTVVDGEKYYDWNENIYLNHNSFTLEAGLEVITANFDETDPAVIKTELISGGEGGSIELKDPWLPDYNESPYGMRNRGMEAPFKSKPSPLNLTLDSEYKGVFLNQDYIDPNKPYYSVGADDQNITVNGKDITWHFQRWEGTNVDFKHPDQNYTAVVFKQPNAEARAMYKGHLASNNSRATGYNTGRRAVRDGSGNLHMVYEDNGAIWYTSSSNDGNSWSQEECISGMPKQVYLSTHSYANPSISVNHSYAPPYGIFICSIIYETVVQYESITQHIITSHTMNNDGNGWSSKEYPANNTLDPIFGTFNGPEGERPVIMSTTNVYITAAWRNPVNGKITAIRKSDSNTWSDAYDIPGTDGYPLLAQTPEQENVIVWVSNGYLRHVKSKSNSVTEWSSVHMLPTDCLFANEKPSITINKNTGRLCVTWVGLHYYNCVKEIYYQEYTLSSTPQAYGNLAVLYTLNVSNSIEHVNPSIGYDPAGPINIFYDDNNGYLWSKQKSGSHWTSYYYSDGLFPNALDGDPRNAVWTRYNTEPYLIKSYVEQTNPVQPVKPINPGLRLNYVLDAAENNGQTGYITLELNQATMDEDTLLFIDNLRTDSLVADIAQMPVTLDLNVSYKDVNVFPGDNEVMFKLDFIDGNHQIPMTNIIFSDLPDSGSYHKSVTVTNLHYRYGYVQLAFANREPFVTYVMNHPDSSVLQKKANFVTNFQPKTIRLHQNYPNPFNPLTHITMELPKESDVNLSVYNIQGRKVRELISGRQNAGVYEVVFDGSGLASGVYFYRLEAGKFSAVKRMLLVK